MRSTAITNVRWYLRPDPPCWLRIEGGRMQVMDLDEVLGDDGVYRVQATAPFGDEIIDGHGLLVAPGYVDIHVHGGGGFDLMTDDPEQVRGYARWAVTRGVTSFLISTAGRDHAEILHRLRALAPVINKPGPGEARALGFHLEGPYINPARKGAFDPRWLRPPNVGEYEGLFEASGGTVRQVTLAPELPGADDLIRAVVKSGAVAAMGHTDATYEQALRAIDLGVSHVTHCYNAMRPFSHRDPGVLAAVMTSDAVTAELIGDGAHVDFAAAALLLRAKGVEKVVLITDGMPLCGTSDGEGEWEGVPIRVEGGKAVRATDATIIGGTTPLDQIVRNAATCMGLHPERAKVHSVEMASRNAAEALHLRDGAGQLASPDDFILLDDDLRVMETWVAGERVHVA